MLVRCKVNFNRSSVSHTLIFTHKCSILITIYSLSDTARFMPSMANIDVSRMVGSLSASQFNYQLMKMSAVCEVYQGLFLIFELALPTRNIMLLYLWWQYLQMRYMMDQTGNMKAAFVTVDQKISGLISHRYSVAFRIFPTSDSLIYSFSVTRRMCPAIVRQGYDMVKGFMAKQVEVREGVFHSCF